MTRRLFLSTLGAALLSPALLSANGLRAAPVFHLRWSPVTRVMHLVFRNRCTSGSRRYLGHDITAVVEDGAVILTGRFRFDRGGHISSADCMNHQSAEVSIPHVPPGTYRIVQDGEDWSEVTLAQAPVEQLFDPQMAKLPPGRAPRPWFGPGESSG